MKSNTKTENNQNDFVQSAENYTDYEKIKNLVSQGKNVFLTGSAGTGKSYILNKLKIDFPYMQITATTGAAAVNVGGTTIHSFACVGIGEDTAETIFYKTLNSPRAASIKACKLLAIDEISMLNDHMMNLIDEVFQRIRNDQRPFGGIQIIVIGDFLQLPPVQREEDRECDFAFSSQSWIDSKFETFLLKKVYRQDDEKFLSILNNLRYGNLSREDYGVLLSNTRRDEDILHLYARNKSANDFNMMKLNQIKQRVYFFKGYDCGDRKAISLLHKYCLAPIELYLKVGARVMMLINLDIENGIINGSIGTVTKIDYENDQQSVVVIFDNGVTKILNQMKINEIKVDGEVVAYRVQIPLRLAWAISIHKAQGMTLENVQIDMEGIFEYGQAYVALSRVKSLEGLSVRNFDIDSIKAHPKAVEFNNRLEELS